MLDCVKLSTKPPVEVIGPRSQFNPLAYLTTGGFNSPPNYFLTLHVRVELYSHWWPWRQCGIVGIVLVVIGIDVDAHVRIVSWTIGEMDETKEIKLRRAKAIMSGAVGMVNEDQPEPTQF
eukprot:1314101-Pyramimonas_sp.AAC.1